MQEAKSELEKFGFKDPVAIADRMLLLAPPIKGCGMMVVDRNSYRTLKFRKYNKIEFGCSRIFIKRARIKDNARR